MKIPYIIRVLSVMHGAVVTAGLQAQTTAFTCQGRFSEDGAAFSGDAEIMLTLWDAATGGTRVAVIDPETMSIAPPRTQGDAESSRTRDHTGSTKSEVESAVFRIRPPRSRARTGVSSAERKAKAQERGRGSLS